jgi:hypothetical protein
LNAELSCGGDTFANYADCLQERLSAAEGTSLNQFINVAIVGKLSALEMEEFFRARAATGKRGTFFAFLDGAGGEEPCESDTPINP